MTIRPGGDGAPLLCVHPLGGRALCYRALAAALGGDRPIHGLEAAGLDGLEPPRERIEEMAAAYLEAARARHPRGPYVLAGWSFGGLVAFEMAQQLRRAGDQAHLVLLDTSLAGTLADPDDVDPETIALSMLARGVESLGGASRDAALAALRALPDEDARLAHLLDQASRSAVLPADIGPEQIRLFLRVVEASDRAWRAYRPLPYPSSALLLRTASPPGMKPGDPTLGWGGVVLDLDLRPLPGEHHRVLDPPAVQTVARHIADWLGGERADH